MTSRRHYYTRTRQCICDKNLVYCHLPKLPLISIWASLINMQICGKSHCVELAVSFVALTSTPNSSQILRHSSGDY